LIEEGVGGSGMDIKTRWKRTKGTRLLSTKGTFLALPSPREGLTLEISASPDTWRTLYLMSFAKPEDIVTMIRNLSKSNFDYISAKPGREDFLDKIKRYAAYVYCWAEYWLKKPQDEWPESLTELVRKLDKYAYCGGKESPESQRVTAYIMEMDFGKEREKYHLRKWTKDPETFARTFISNNKYAKFVKAICRS
jgi:hypothetical protein